MSLALRDYYRQGRLVPFVGAGVSMSVRWEEAGSPGVVRSGPSWSALVDRAAQELGFSDAALLRARGTDLQILEYFHIKHHGEVARITNWLARTMEPPNEALLGSPIHAELAKLDRVNHIYTTNYDNFIERSLHLLGRPCKVVAVESDMAHGQACEVIKFHGDLDHPSHMVLTESHYDARLSFSAPMDFRLRSDLLNRVLLFLGYSFRDYNVSYLFRLMNEALKRASGSMTGPRAFIAVPDPSDFENTLFRARNIEVIPIRGASMTSDIAEILRDLRA